jgi:hypothetical protein
MAFGAATKEILWCNDLWELGVFHSKTRKLALPLLLGNMGVADV